MRYERHPSRGGEMNPGEKTRCSSAKHSKMYSFVTTAVQIGSPCRIPSKFRVSIARAAVRSGGENDRDGMVLPPLSASVLRRPAVTPPSGSTVPVEGRTIPISMKNLACPNAVPKPTQLCVCSPGCCVVFTLLICRHVRSQQGTVRRKVRRDIYIT